MSKDPRPARSDHQFTNPQGERGRGGGNRRVRLRHLAALLFSVTMLGCHGDPSTTGKGMLTPPAIQGDILVFAASSLGDAFNEIAERFKASHPEARLVINTGASSQLVTQLEQGARADVFASADTAQMDRARALQLVENEVVLFAANRLVIIVPTSTPGRLTEPRDIGRPGLKLVTSQADVPIGAYTQLFIDRLSQELDLGASFRDNVTRNIVSREANVRQIVAKVVLGEADAGVVYQSDVTPQVAQKVTAIPIPDEFNTRVTYPAALARGAQNWPGGSALINYLRSKEGQQILRKWGFEAVTPSPSD